MAQPAGPGYELRLLNEADSCTAFKLGDASLAGLKIFLQRHAKRFQKTDIARTFVLVEQGKPRVLAYATILCTQMRVDQVTPPDGLGDFPYTDYPAIRLARLAVDKSQQGKGMGSLLVDFILALVLDQIMPNAGCRFLIVDAKPGSVSFYARKGFSRIGDMRDGTDPLTLMFVDLNRLKPAP